MDLCLLFEGVSSILEQHSLRKQVEPLSWFCSSLLQSGMDFHQHGQPSTKSIAELKMSTEYDLKMCKLQILLFCHLLKHSPIVRLVTFSPHHLYFSPKLDFPMNCVVIRPQEENCGWLYSSQVVQSHSASCFLCLQCSDARNRWQSRLQSRVAFAERRKCVLQIAGPFSCITGAVCILCSRAAQLQKCAMKWQRTMHPFVEEG